METKEKIFIGLYSKFRYPEYKYTGFSPLVAYLMSKSNFIQEMRRNSEENYKFNNLLKLLFHETEGHVVPTSNYRFPIYIITKLGLLPNLIHCCMFSIDFIEQFFSVHNDKIIEKYKELYFDKIDDECQTKLDEISCTGKINLSGKIISPGKGKCRWNKLINSCSIREDPWTKSYDMKRNLRNFIRDIDLLKTALTEAYIESETSLNDPKHNDVPFYVFGMILTFYWFQMRIDKTIEQYLKEYLDIITFSELEISDEINEIDDMLSEICVDNPQIITMEHLKYNNSEFPNCVETMINNFFNAYLYDPINENFNTGLFSDELHINQELVNFYSKINDDLRTNKLSINDINITNVKELFLRVLVNIPEIKYRSNGYNIISDQENVLKVFNYLLGTNVSIFSELKLSTDLQIVEIEDNIFTFKSNDTIIKKITLYINPGHSYSVFENNIKNIISTDNISSIILNIVSSGSENEEVSKYTQIEKLSYFNYLYLNRNITNLSENKNYIELPILTFTFDRYTFLYKDYIFSFNIKHLNISYTYYGKLPKEIGNLPQLKTLYLNNNQLTELPKEIGNLIKLQTLDVSSNKIIKLPEEIGNLIKLQTLDVLSNKIIKLPEEIGNLTQTQGLKIKNF